ncbi:MAG: glucose-1-phosphate adenylyltransferase [Marinisporobacter sp.]|jgi:glucose-1-phosphate adenylyltransferase|nr:glucose-1-phosphate adenylyltransferase [Marinisporobacter sp.]
MTMKKECIAMILAGGRGNRLGILTKKLAKPAVPFGGKYRIIDFTLSNCTNSGIDTVGVLTQYRPLKLNAYIGSGLPWDLDRENGGVTVLQPCINGQSGEWYKGTANAIYQNIEFVEQYNPKYVFVLSGDHVYKMDYSKMLEHHKNNQADATIAVMNVPLSEASRFGIMNTHDDNYIYEFEEKPQKPKSNKASMGVYIFNWDILKKYLIEDEINTESNHDFGKNIIPAMLQKGQRMYAYPFTGYWKDVGTIHSYWESNMDLISDEEKLNLFDSKWSVYSRNNTEPSHFLGESAEVKNSIIADGSLIYGRITNSIVSSGVVIGRKCEIENSIILPGCVVGEGTKIQCAVIGEESTIKENCRIGFGQMKENKNFPDIYCSEISIVGEKITIPSGTVIGKNCVLEASLDEEKIIDSGGYIKGDGAM